MVKQIPAFRIVRLLENARQMIFTALSGADALVLSSRGSLSAAAKCINPVSPVTKTSAWSEGAPREKLIPFP